MAKHTHQGIAGALALAKAKRRLHIGPVDAPSQVVLDVHGIPFFPGQQLIDTVTGQTVTVIHGGVTNENVTGS